MGGKPVVRELKSLAMLLLLLLFTACGSGSDEGEPTKPEEKPVLKLYLFAPDHPIITRADVGNVDASVDENRVNTLDVWVFEQGTSTLVSHARLNNLTFDAQTGQKEITMDISKEFADKSPKPQVDIFVAANAAACCDQVFNKNTTTTALKAALIKKGDTEDFFGLTDLTLGIPVMPVPEAGLPMSGFLKNQTVTGTAPVFTAKVNNVKLVRAVSKVRLIFSKSNSTPPAISDLSVSLNAGMLPNQEYLFLDYDDNTGIKYHINAEGGYNEAATLIEGVRSDAERDDINDCVNPASYEFRFASATEGGQDYEDRINEGLTTQTGQTNPDLSELGRFYFRESDKQLKGTISYTLGSGESAQQKSAEFSMASSGDFTRNHTWIVYGYFLGSGELVLNVVCVKNWTEDNDDGKLHNW